MKAVFLGVYRQVTKDAESRVFYSHSFSLQAPDGSKVIGGFGLDHPLAANAVAWQELQEAVTTAPDDKSKAEAMLAIDKAGDEAMDKMAGIVGYIVEMNGGRWVPDTDEITGLPVKDKRGTACGKVVPEVLGTSIAIKLIGPAAPKVVVTGFNL